MRLDQGCFAEHVASRPFQDGVARGYWDVALRDGVEWPYAMIWIDAPSRPNSPERFFLRFHLQDYPAKGPTATLWDLDKNSQLDLAKWPKGDGDVGMVFRTNWKGAVGLYAPWDRYPLEDHPDWPQKYPGFVWKPTYTIAHYLRLTRELLHTDEYRGC